ncbi:hypothetical protein EB796_025094 [Bugula neritina]|uniref:Uncharacterized protein n=1 Tax=Bugula neritina TaxID=10212 RepID=A0A7J7IRL2_BUGNE|nr:hypothetical protein EB796_025094 [Bugula neritina]
MAERATVRRLCRLSTVILKKKKCILAASVMKTTIVYDCCHVVTYYVNLVLRRDIFEHARGLSTFCVLNASINPLLALLLPAENAIESNRKVHKKRGGLFSGWTQPSKGDTYKNVATDFQKDVTELFSKHEKRLEKTLDPDVRVASKKRLDLLKREIHCSKRVDERMILSVNVTKFEAEYYY